MWISPVVKLSIATGHAMHSKLLPGGATVVLGPTFLMFIFDKIKFPAWHQN